MSRHEEALGREKTMVEVGLEVEDSSGFGRTATSLGPAQPVMVTRPPLDPPQARCPRNLPKVSGYESG